MAKHEFDHADFLGVLRGEALAAAYANMDLFAFPSRTDTFGNVVLEALASGVPAVVTDAGGPKFIVDHGASGFVAATGDAFIERVAELIGNPGLHRAMALNARRLAAEASWDRVFRKVYEAYAVAVAAHPA